MCDPVSPSELNGNIVKGSVSKGAAREACTTPHARAFFRAPGVAFRVRLGSDCRFTGSQPFPTIPHKKTKEAVPPQRAAPWSATWGTRRGSCQAGSPEPAGSLHGRNKV